MEVAKAAASDLKRVHLELGGKAPVIVFDDADIELAVAGIVTAGYFNAGQDCTAATRLLVQEGIHDEFVAALAEYARDNATTGAPDEDVLFGPLNNADQFARVGGLHRRAARPREGRARRPPARRRSGYFYDATIVSEPQADRRRGAERDLRAGADRAALLDRGAGAAVGERRAVRALLVRLDAATTARAMRARSASTSAACGSTRTSRSSPRCRTAASSTPATARISRCTASRTTLASST